MSSSISPEGTTENSSAFHCGTKVLNTSPFYAEAGGQVGDLGLLTNAAGAGMGWKLGGIWGYGGEIFRNFLGIFIGNILINHGIWKELPKVHSNPYGWIMLDPVSVGLKGMVLIVRVINSVGSMLEG